VHGNSLWNLTQSLNLKPFFSNKKHLKNVGPIHHWEPPHAHSPDVASGTVARRLRIDVHDIDNDDNDDNDNDNA